MGGMIGQTFALKYPGVFRTLTLADTTSRYPAEAAPVWADRIKTVEAKGMEPLAQPTLERWFTEPFRKSNPAVVDGDPQADPRDAGRRLRRLLPRHPENQPHARG